MISNEKNLKYKVVNLVESYKFRMKFISIRVHKNTSRSFENRLTQTAMARDGRSL
jgi:hypothetical protein